MTWTGISLLGFCPTSFPSIERGKMSWKMVRRKPNSISKWQISADKITHLSSSNLRAFGGREQDCAKSQAELWVSCLGEVGFYLRGFSPWPTICPTLPVLRQGGVLDTQYWWFYKTRTSLELTFLPWDRMNTALWGWLSQFTISEDARINGRQITST